MLVYRLLNICKMFSGRQFPVWVCDKGRFLVLFHFVDTFASGCLQSDNLCCCQGRPLPQSDMSAETLLQMVSVEHLLKGPDGF